jgi:hypothetical protein
MNKEMDLESALIALSHHEAFAFFITNIKNMREEIIGEMANASVEELQQISGRILAYDDILQMVNMEDIQRRFG